MRSNLGYIYVPNLHWRVTKIGKRHVTITVFFFFIYNRGVITIIVVISTDNIATITEILTPDK